MKHWIFIVMLCSLAAAAYANPVIMFDPISAIPYAIVLGSATVIEVGLITLVLLFWGIEPVPLYLAAAIGNLVIYFTAFLPLLDSTNMWISEAVVVALDALLIKLLVRYDTFRGDSFRPLKWPWAFVIAAVGNIVSYYVGVVTTAKP
jgi:hypothetical protein